MIVDAALADLGEGFLDGGLGERLVVADRPAPQQPEEVPLRELRRPLEAAVVGVHRPQEPRGEILQRSIRNDEVLVRGRTLGEHRRDEVRVVIDRGAVVVVDVGDLTQHGGKGGLAIAAILGEVRAAPEGLRVRVEEHGQRPAALLAQPVQRAHVDRVDVGPLLAVDFDVDVEFVHDGGGGLVLEAFVRHDVAPVTGRIPDRQQDRLAGRLGLGQRVGPPRPPVHGVIGVLEEIGRGLAREAVVGHGGVLEAVCSHL